jgi:hypothetical protein
MLDGKGTKEYSYLKRTIRIVRNINISISRVSAHMDEEATLGIIYRLNTWLDRILVYYLYSSTKLVRLTSLTVRSPSS